MPVQKPYESDHDFDLRVPREKCRFQKEMLTGITLTVVRDGKELESWTEYTIGHDERWALNMLTRSE
jgi:hypothetical protein